MHAMMSARKTNEKCKKCGSEMEVLRGPFEVRERKLQGNFRKCTNRNCGNTVPDEALEMSIMNAEDW